MKKQSQSLKRNLTGVVAIAATALAFSSCDVKKTQEGEMPEVKVEGGQMPKYDVETPEVKIEEKTIELPDSITVPDVDIVTPEEKAAGGNVESGEAPDMEEAAPATTPADGESM